METFFKKALLPIAGAVLAGSGAALSNVDPSPYATEIGAAFGGLIACMMQLLRSKANDAP